MNKPEIQKYIENIKTFKDHWSYMDSEVSFQNYLDMENKEVGTIEYFEEENGHFKTVLYTPEGIMIRTMDKRSTVVFDEKMVAYEGIKADDENNYSEYVLVKKVDTSYKVPKNSITGEPIESAESYNLFKTNVLGGRENLYYHSRAGKIAGSEDVVKHFTDLEDTFNMYEEAYLDIQSESHM